METRQTKRARTLVIFVVVLAAATVQAQGPPAGLAVRIVSPSPLPVTGSVSVRDQDHPDRNAFRMHLCRSGTLACSAGEPTSFTAPLDKNVVIDVFSGECSAANGTAFRSLSAVIDDRTVHQFAPNDHVLPPGSSHTIYQWNKQTRIVVLANEEFRGSANVLDSGLAYCRFYVSGYTVTP